MFNKFILLTVVVMLTFAFVQNVDATPGYLKLHNRVIYYFFIALIVLVLFNFVFKFHLLRSRANFQSSRKICQPPWIPIN